MATFYNEFIPSKYNNFEAITPVEIEVAMTPETDPTWLLGVPQNDNGATVLPPVETGATPYTVPVVIRDTPTAIPVGDLLPLPPVVTVETEYESGDLVKPKQSPPDTDFDPLPPVYTSPPIQSGSTSSGPVTGETTTSGPVANLPGVQLPRTSDAPQDFPVIRSPDARWLLAASIAVAVIGAVAFLGGQA